MMETDTWVNTTSGRLHISVNLASSHKENFSFPIVKDTSRFSWIKIVRQSRGLSSWQKILTRCLMQTVVCGSDASKIFLAVLLVTLQWNKVRWLRTPANMGIFFGLVWSCKLLIVHYCMQIIGLHLLFHVYGVTIVWHIGNICSFLEKSEFYFELVRKQKCWNRKFVNCLILIVYSCLYLGLI